MIGLEEFSRTAAIVRAHSQRRRDLLQMLITEKRFCVKKKKCIVSVMVMFSPGYGDIYVTFKEEVSSVSVFVSVVVSDRAVRFCHI